MPGPFLVARRGHWACSCGRGHVRESSMIGEFGGFGERRRQPRALSCINRLDQEYIVISNIYRHFCRYLWRPRHSYSRDLRVVSAVSTRNGVAERCAYWLPVVPGRLGMRPATRSMIGQGIEMKKLFLATTAILALSAGSASAADLSRPVYKAAPPPPPACAQFGGFYVGGYGGAGYYDHKWNDRDAWTSELSDDLQRSNVSTQKTGFIGGVQGGYNWQTGCTVFGLQADYGWASINADALRDRQRSRHRYRTRLQCPAV